MAYPQRINKYEVQGVLGKGAMGVVYRARDPGIGREVAIKTIHKHLLSGEMGHELKERFLREVQAVGNLRHPNIIAIYDTDTADGTPYFVMEFVQGKELGHYLKEGQRFALEHVDRIVGQLLDAFAYCHDRGIIHRDIKPANIFITEEGDVKVADFGIARVENSELTQMGTALGTPSYMSPEQCTGQPVDNRADLFSIGIVLYELLTGEKPFQGTSVHALMHKIVHSPADAPSLLNPALPKSVDKVVAKALAKNPQDRFQNAREFADALKAAMAGEEVKLDTGYWPTVLGSGSLVFALLMGLFLWLRPDPAVLVAAPSNSPFAGVLPPTQEPVSLTSAQQEKITKFLRVADLAVKSERLVWPPNSNAVYVYQLALAIDPNQREARAGLQYVAKLLLERAQQLKAEGDEEALRKHLEVSLQALPDFTALRDLQRQL